MSASFGVLTGLLLVAQTSEATPEDLLEKLHIPGFEEEEEGTSVDLEFEIAPEIVSYGPLGANGRTSDATNLTSTLVIGQPLGEDWGLEFSIGPSYQIIGDPDEEAESSIAAGLEIAARSGFGSLRPFIGYEIERVFSGFFDEGEETGQTFVGGLRYGGSAGPIAVGLELAPRLVLSSEPLGDYAAVNFWGEIVVPLGSEVNFYTDASIERRWYLDEDLELLSERRDWRFEAFVGVDLADAVGGSLLPEGVLRGLGFGLRAVRVSSNLDDVDQSSLRVLPTVTVGISF